MSTLSQSDLAAPFERKIVSARMEKQLRQPVLFGHLGPAIEQAMMPFVAKVSEALQSTDTTVLAIAQLLFEKGVITREELDSREQDVTLKLHEAMQRMTEGPATAKEQAPGAEPTQEQVTRRLEQLGQTPATDAAPARLVEA